MAEIAFEKFALALEVARGTAVTPPTDTLDMKGSITPMEDVARPDNNAGTLAKNKRSEIIHKWCEWELEGDADVKRLPKLANTFMQPVSAPTTPVGATLARLWTFLRLLTADTIKSTTLYGGDPNQMMLKAPYAMTDEFEMSSDTGGDDMVQMSLSGHGRWPTDLTGVSIPVLPAAATYPTLVPQDMQLWIDTSGAIGDTEVLDRVLNVTVTTPTGVTYKYPATGPTGGRTYSRTGREKAAPEMVIEFDFVDQDEYDKFKDGVDVKARVRFNGAEIETGFRYFVEWDIYGKLTDPSWGELEGSNRTLELTIVGEENASVGSDLVLRVQNINTAL